MSKNDCRYRNSWRWRMKGGKCAGAYLVAPNACNETCKSYDECVKSSFADQLPEQDFSTVNIYLNNRAKADIIEQKPEQENQQDAKEVNEIEEPLF